MTRREFVTSTAAAAAAGIVDRFSLPGFHGPWVGAGLEHWWNTIGSPSGPATASWNSWVGTAGAGYVWKVWGNLHLNPWASAHLLLSRPEVTLHGATWTPARFLRDIASMGVEVDLRLDGEVDSP